MTKSELLTAIRNKCIEANRSILDLTFGCELKRPGSERHYKIIEDRGWGGNKEKVWVNSVPFGRMEIPVEVNKKEIGDGEKWEVIGREIQLADVLLAIDRARPLKQEWYVRYDGQFRDVRNDTWANVFWKVSKPFSGQSLPTLEFIYQLIK